MSFIGQLANCNNIKYWDDMSGFCLACNEYGYTLFKSLIAIARNTFLQKDQLDNVLQEIDTLKRHLCHGYERELVINANSIAKHNPCIFHCLPYAFEKCLKNHKSRYLKSNIDENGALFVTDYKMKILPKSAWKTKAEFFGKREWTLHIILVFTKKNNCKELDIRAYNY
ncbi:hypothetical protein RclHR1_10020007 [Rhizophagus clarus]|uniref:Uncharacterized protein n=1 Tax=Rhizophagus clarus TaxID=94130 RepID=A0A2Z6Q0L0_9GLOM|nr:hypothetical protein RclHR1_10020007 [Rhizophagus clarus]